MNRKTLTSLFSETIYQIPDYQRGYAWEKEQLNDFIQDIDALVDEDVKSHYTGTVVVYVDKTVNNRTYGNRLLKVVDIVDGQQRLTTSCLYLSVIIRALLSKGESAYEREIYDFLYAGPICKITLNNDTGNVFFDLLRNGHVMTPVQSTHGKRLTVACDLFQTHINQQLEKRGDGGITYLRNLFNAVTQKLHFTFYAIEEECEIGMTFELMNSRGKGLAVLELLKNYLMYWVSRNETELHERQNITSIINTNWSDVYTNIGSCAGNEDQCLRIAWTLYCNHSPKKWIGYNGFKSDEYIPLRNFNLEKTKDSTKNFISKFSYGLAEISTHYACITRPTSENTVSPEELIWLKKIHQTNNIANFLPLLVAARKHCVSGEVTKEDYIKLLQALECFSYRVFLFDRRRSNAGKSSFYRWGHEIFYQPKNIIDVIYLVYELTRNYSTEKSFLERNANPHNWYGSRHLLKYTLYEYELYLLKSEGRGMQPNLTWAQLKDSTIEHILPQNPAENSDWNSIWNAEDFKSSIHDIGNLVLTQNNSNYSNFEFSRKKGSPGRGPSYSHADIRQEREIASYINWSPIEFLERRNKLVGWINKRWKTNVSEIPLTLDIDDEADEDGFDAVNQLVELELNT